MKMYRCNDCGHLFEEGEEARWEETHGLDTPPYEQMRGCPICKSSYEEVEPCKICGSYDCEYGEKYCNECKKNVQKRFSDFIEKEFDEEERKLLNELYDGEEI